MPLLLAVTDIRNHLYWAAGGPQSAGDGEPTVALLGALFHQILECLTGPDTATNFVAPLRLADSTLESWQQSLVNHAYATLVAPSLCAHQAVLQTRSSEVLSYWQAVRALCDWLASVVFEQRRNGESLETIRQKIFKGTEQEISVKLTDQGWHDTVELTGRADSILAQRDTEIPCVVEVKLGRTFPEADLLQACLYHMMFEEAGFPENARLALVAFEPNLHEYIFEADQLRDAKAKLKALIWRLASGETSSKGKARKAKGPDLTPRTQVAELQSLGGQLEAAFAEFGSAIELEGAPIDGPTFIRFLAKPKRGVTVKSLLRQQENVWVRLKTSEAPTISTERGRVVIDIENPQRRSVPFADWRNELPERLAGGISQFAVGVTVDGNLHFADLARPESAHFLVAGTSGSGKTEWLRAALMSLMASNSPATLKFALIDPKRTGFGVFEGSEYLLRPVVYSEGVIELLEELVEEMEQRYALLQGAQADDLAEYNGTTSTPIPRVVCVCDEYADILLADRKRRDIVETHIARLGSKARAAGIHLIFATQRPSRQIVSGVISANLSGRVVLKVVREIESRLILDEHGAESLLGKGDLLYKDIGSPVRLQGLYVTKDELVAQAMAS